MLTYVYLSGGYSVLMYKVIRYVIFEWALWISLLQQNNFTEKLKLWGNLTLKFHVCLSPLKIKKIHMNYKFIDYQSINKI